MKTLATTLLMSLAALSMGAAYAGPVSEPDNLPFAGVYGQAAQGASVAQVQAELAQARAQGLIVAGNADAPAPLAAGRSDIGPTRAQVQADLARARAAGQISVGEADLPFQGNAGSASQAQLASM